MTKEKMIDMCEEIINGGYASAAMAILADAVKMELARKNITLARNRAQLKAAKKILDANARVDKATRESLLGLLEVDE